MKNTLISLSLALMSLSGFAQINNKTNNNDTHISKYVAPVRKDTVQLLTGVNLIEPAGPLDTLYLKMPSSAYENSNVTIMSTTALTKILWVANGTMVNQISAGVAGTPYRYIYRSTNSKWYKY
jgi:hypothetical protein